MVKKVTKKKAVKAKAPKKEKMPEIKDERCYCGHLRSEHDYHAGARTPANKGKGRCLKCACFKFVWKEYIY